MGDLRLGRVEGWQPYNQFVRRHLGNNYDFIDIVGQRYDRIQNAIERFGEQLRTAELGRQTAVTAEQTTKIAQLQELADKIFWIALFPYYFSTFWVEVIEGLEQVHFFPEKLPFILPEEIISSMPEEMIALLEEMNFPDAAKLSTRLLCGILGLIAISSKTEQGQKFLQKILIKFNSKEKSSEKQHEDAKPQDAEKIIPPTNE